MKDRVMPLGLAKYLISKKFEKLNDYKESENLDWSYLKKDCTFSENYHFMKENHPKYRWDYPDKIQRQKTVKKKKTITLAKTYRGWERVYGYQLVKGVTVKSHTAYSKGKKYTYGRIQASIDANLIGSKVWIIVNLPEWA